MLINYAVKAKKYKFIGLFGIVILWLFPSCVTSYQAGYACLVCVVMRLRLDNTVSNLLYQFMF